MKVIKIIILVILLANPGISSTKSSKRELKPQFAKLEQKQNPIKKGIRLFKAGKLDESQTVFESILQRDKNSLIAKEMLAIISYRKKDYKAAIIYAKGSLKQNQKSAKAHLVLAGVFRDKGNTLAARDHFRKAKKFISPREKESLQEFLLKNKLDINEKIDEIPINKEDYKYKVMPVGEKPYIAVFSFEEKNLADDDKRLANTISEMLTTALIQTNRFQVLERSQLDKILEEQALGLSGALDEETAIDVGKLLGVDAVVIGNAGMLKKQIELDARIVDATSGKAHVAANASASDESQLRNAVNELARNLAANANNIPIQREETKSKN